MILFGNSSTKKFGYVALALGAFLVFLNGYVFLLPVSLIQFTLGFAAMALGWRLFSGNRPAGFL
ncbi:tsr0692 [Thermosynechococcus vestitus BP-1]|uniref:Tsr0692 protein n=2 Tax=Thermosynechococcus vestitus TaxID=146786 RepID=Q8DL07_THEVB|nr:tsr0692 [Thermosynechococcus vestitus BP-1]